MLLFRTASPRQVDFALATLRVIVGIVFIAHGAQKLFVFGLPDVTAGFTQMGTPMPAIVAPLVALVEFGGGIALVTGLLTRLAALGLAVDLLGATLLVHLASGFFLPRGYEFTLTVLAASVSLMIAGAGAFSIDALIANRRSGVGEERARASRTA